MTYEGKVQERNHDTLLPVLLSTGSNFFLNIIINQIRGHKHMDSEFISCGPGNDIILIYRASLRHFWHQFVSTFVPLPVHCSELTVQVYQYKNLLTK